MQLSNQLKSRETIDIDKYKEWMNFYAKRNGIKVIFDNEMQAPAAINLNDIKHPTIILNPYMIKEKFNYSDEEILVDIFHELEHLKEESKMRSTDNGKKIYKKNIQKLEEKKHLRNTYFQMQNIFRDFFVDGQLVSPENMPVLYFTLIELCRKKLYKNKNYLEFPIEDKNGKVIQTKPLPKHLQFLYTIIREERIKDEKCILDKDVLRIIQRLRRNWSLESATTGKMEDRLQAMWKIEPIFQKLLDEDIKKEEEQENAGESSENSDDDSNWDSNWDNNENSDENSDDNSNWDNNDNSDENSDDDSNWDSNENSDDNFNWDSNWKNNENNENSDENSNWDFNWDKNENSDENSDDDSNWDSDWDNNENSDENSDENSNWDSNWDNNENSDSSKWGKKKWKLDNKWDKPKNPFDEYYNKQNNLWQILKNALEKEELEQLGEILNNYEENRAKIKSKQELELENRAKLMGINTEDKEALEEIIQQLREYENFLEQLEKVENPETWESVMEEIEKLFDKIRSHRLKNRYKAKWPVDIEKWVRLHGPSLATGIAEIKSWNINPEIFEEDIKSLKELPFVGKFDLTIVADGSWSMTWPKNIQQKIAILLLFEALKRLHDKLEEEEYKLKQWIEFNTEWLMFNWKTVDNFKESSANFTDKERLKSYNILDYDNWDYTNDYDSLEEIYNKLLEKDDQYLQDIMFGKTKKIVFVMTDGNSSDSTKLKHRISKLRELWVLVYGIWITKEGKGVINNYAWENEILWKWEVCKKPEELSITIKDILMPHLETL